MIGSTIVRSIAGQVNAVKAAVLAVLAASNGSGLVGFIHSATGAVARNVLDKLRDRVTLEDFGGSPALADNHDAFVAAIASGYSPIYLKADTYVTSPITVDNVRVKFQGSSGTAGAGTSRKAVIKLKDASASHLFTLTGDSAKLHLENVSLDGNKAGQALANSGIYAGDAGAWAESAELVASHVRNCKGDGVRLGQNRNRLHVLLRSYIAENDGYGVWSVGALDHKFADSEVGDNGLTNVYIDGTAAVQAANMVFTNTELYHGGLLNQAQAHNLYLGGRVSEFTWLGGDCLGAQKNGVHIAQLLLATPSAISLHGVRMFGNSKSVTNTYSDVFDDRGGCSFVALKHQPAAGAIPKYLYEMGPNTVRASMALGALYTVASYGTAFTSNSGRLAGFDELRARMPTDHAGWSFSANDLTKSIVSVTNAPTGQPTFTIAANGTMLWGAGAGAADAALIRQQADLLSVGASDAFNARTALWLTDGVTSQFAQAGFAKLFIDEADGDLKIRFSDGTLKTVMTD